MAGMWEWYFMQFQHWIGVGFFPSYPSLWPVGFRWQKKGLKTRGIHGYLRIFCYTPIHSHNKMVAESLPVWNTPTHKMSVCPVTVSTEFRKGLTINNLLVQWLCILVCKQCQPFSDVERDTKMWQCWSSGTKYWPFGISFLLSLFSVLENRKKTYVGTAVMEMESYAHKCDIL